MPQIPGKEKVGSGEKWREAVRSDRIRQKVGSFENAQDRENDGRTAGTEGGGAAGTGIGMAGTETGMAAGSGVRQTANGDR